VLTFREWLLEEEQRTFVPQSVLNSYEHAFKDALNDLIRRTQDPVLRAKFREMFDCPIRDQRGQCRPFTHYIVGALIRNNIHTRYDMESVLSYIFQKMMMPVSDTGQPKSTVFSGFDETKPYFPGGNPLQIRFMKFLQFAVNNVRKGKIPRLAQVGRRPEGTVSIGQGRKRNDAPAVGISPEAIPARQSSDASLEEMIEDITTLLKKQEPSTGLPLARFFNAVMAGQRTDQQSRLFGDRQMRGMRDILKQTLLQYADSTGNYSLLNLLQRYEGFQSSKAMPATRTAAKVVKPVLTDQQRDYASIISVIDRLGGRPAGTADLGKYRRRWLEYPPRDAASGHRNRLEEVLARMVQDGVLKATRTAKGALVYSPGPNYEQYRQPAA
jgi:hypothetical protein